jgi:hypothetical protein
MKQQLPQLKQRVSERASSSRTKPRRKRTFAGLLPWEGFADEVQEFTEGLDDMEACYKPLVRHCLPVHAQCMERCMPMACKYRLLGNV